MHTPYDLAVRDAVAAYLGIALTPEQAKAFNKALFAQGMRLADKGDAPHYKQAGNTVFVAYAIPPN
jgi:hypothetical protein